MSKKVNAKRRKLNKRTLALYVMMIPGFVYIFINNYMPLPGLSIAFKRFDYSKGLWDSPWVGLGNFTYLFKTKDAFNMIRNTLGYNFVFILLGNIIAVLVAIMLNFIKGNMNKKVYQTLILIPYLLSTVVVSYIVYAFLGQESGFLNNILAGMGQKRISWYTESKYWPFILTFVYLWKNFGYSSILYYATVIGIDSSLYEAAILHEDEADALEAFLLKHPEVYLLSDEVYETIVYDGIRSVSMASRESVKERVITVNGFSKCAAMTGWRIGYLTCNAELFGTIYKLYQHSLSCMSGFLQVGAAAVFECKEEMKEMCRIYTDRRDRFVGILNSIEGVKCPMPEGAFYAWVYYDLYGMTSEEICEYLLEKAGVVGMPGSAYGEMNVCCMRFSFANAMEELEDAGLRIKNAIEDLHKLKKN